MSRILKKYISMTSDFEQVACVFTTRVNSVFSEFGNTIYVEQQGTYLSLIGLSF